MRFVGLCAIVVAFAIILKKSDTIAKLDRRRLFAVSLILALPLPALTYVIFAGGAPPLVISYICWGINGLASALIFLMWAHYFSRLSKGIVASLAISFLIAACWYYIVSFLPVMTRIAGEYLSLPLSIACLTIFVGESVSQDFVSKKESIHIIDPNIQTLVSLVVTGLAGGYLLHRVVDKQPYEAVYIIGFAIALCAVLTIGIGKFFGPRALLIAPISRCGFPVLIAGLILRPFVEGSLLALCETVLLAVLIEHGISTFASFSFVMRKHEVQAVYLWSQINIMSLLGIAGGWGLSVFADYISVTLNGINATDLVLSLVLVVVFAARASIAPLGMDCLSSKRNFHPEGEEVDDDQKGLWHASCQYVADGARLTPRETDVFFFLAKGRSSKIIERELSISNNTVKSHNYNIYRKLGIESQQELIDAVELVYVKNKSYDKR